MSGRVRRAGLAVGVGVAILVGTALGVTLTPLRDGSGASPPAATPVPTSSPALIVSPVAFPSSSVGTSVPTAEAIPSATAPSGTLIIGGVTVAVARSGLENANYGCDISPFGPPGMAGSSTLACNTTFTVAGATLDVAAHFWSDTAVVAVDLGTPPLEGLDPEFSRSSVIAAIEAIYGNHPPEGISDWVSQRAADAACIETPCSTGVAGATFSVQSGLNGALTVIIAGTALP